MITARIIGTCKWAHPDDYCFNSVEGNTDFCPRHNRLIRKQEQEEKKALQKRADQIAKQKEKNQEPRKKVKPVSDKRKELNQEYFKLVEQFKKDNPECKIKANEFCTTKTDDPHHKRGRGIYLMDVSTWIPCCRSCHIYAEANALEAKEKGWSISRLQITEPHKI